jgi:hypothetical protein
MFETLRNGCGPRRLAVAIVIGLSPLGAQAQEPVYPTYGVHNPAVDSNCANTDCIYIRQPGEPTDPHYPPFWSSHWNMYRVFKGYADNPPPYDGAPPPALKEGTDYEKSHGATYYDSTWTGWNRTGAMMEHYEDRCLPIFPIPNHYTCSFISLGDIAFFVTYEDRPSGMPRVCLFSPVNHPPMTDFIKHLPYSSGDSARLGNRVQGYSFWTDPQTGKPVQTGVSPDLTDKGMIMFGYAFKSEAEPDRVDHSAAPYRHPQSFYFSGFPAPPADAPIVSQNYTDFAMEKPDPKKTWDQVSGLDPKTLPLCQLFNPPAGAPAAAAAAHGSRSWGDIKRK